MDRRGEERDEEEERKRLQPHNHFTELSLMKCYKGRN